MLDRKQQERKIGVGQRAQRGFWKPDRIRQSHQHVFMVAHDRACPEHRVAQAARLGLHDVGELGAAVAVAVIFEDVGFSRRDYKADLVGTSQDQPFDEVFRDSARAVKPVIAAAAYRKQFLGERQWLNAAAASGGWDDTPHR
jgi:hypothetical protein